MALLLAVVLTGVAAGVTQLRVEEAARAAAREIMRGDSAAAETAARRIAGADAQVTLAADGLWLRVQVDSAVAAPLLDRLPLVLSASASALPESLP